MCGIFGAVGGLTPSAEEVRRLTRLMSHRGPDGEGCFFSGDKRWPVALGHRRLAVIDLSTGDQPMFNEDKSVAVVFNGEIYNFRELRRELEEEGHRFATSSDTECIVHGYESWGIDVVTRLDGMFGLALYDAGKKRVLLARDPMGQKPLFFIKQNDGVAFASELNPLTAGFDHGGMNHRAAADYLAHGFISGGMTAYNNINRLPPGHLALIDEKGFETRPYRAIPAKAANPGAREEELADELDELLRKAVRKRLVSDVPLGAFLSGGVDSSLIAALMVRESAEAVSTFSISFDEDTFDESANSKAVADYLGTKHRVERVSLGAEIDPAKIAAAFGEPFGDVSALPTRALSAITRKHVTVALSGDGGDEIFGGYNRYLGRSLVGTYLKAPKAVRRVAELGSALLGESTAYYGNSFRKKLRLFLGQAKEVERGVEGIPGFFSDDEIRRLFPPLSFTGETVPRRAMAGRAGADRVEALMLADQETYLPEDIHVKVDRMSMAASLEVRAPFMDRELIAFGRSLPAEMRVRGFTTKYLLRKVAGRYLPPEVAGRKKHGFSVPVGAWFKKELGEGLLSAAGACEAADAGQVAALLEEHRRGRRDHGLKLWLLYVFMEWLRGSAKL